MPEEYKDMTDEEIRTKIACLERNIGYLNGSGCSIDWEFAGHYRKAVKSLSSELKRRTGREEEMAKLRRERARWGLVAQDAWYSYRYGWYEEATRKIGEIEKAISMLKKSEQEECGQAVRNPNAIRQ